MNDWLQAAMYSDDSLYMSASKYLCALQYLHTPSKWFTVHHLNMYHHQSIALLRWIKESTLRSSVNMAATWLVDSITFIAFHPLEPWIQTNGTLLKYICSWVSFLAIPYFQKCMLLGCFPTNFCSFVICLISSASFSKFCVGNNLHIEVLNAMYSASMVLSPISLCNRLI